jgi:hypothetical protein
MNTEKNALFSTRTRTQFCDDVVIITKTTIEVVTSSGRAAIGPGKPEEMITMMSKQEYFKRKLAGTL